MTAVHNTNKIDVNTFITMDVLLMNLDILKSAGITNTEDWDEQWETQTQRVWMCI